jgi:WD40 repeat protein
MVHIFETQTWKEITTIDGKKYTLDYACFSRDAGRIVTADDEQAQVWDARTGVRLRTLNRRKPNRTWPANWIPGHSNKVSFSSDGMRIVTMLEGVIQLWDAATYQEVRIPELDANIEEVISIGPKGEIAATLSEDGALRLRDVRSGQQIWTTDVGKEQIQAAAFNNDGQVFSVTFQNDYARLWSADSGREIALLGGPEIGVERAEFVGNTSIVFTPSQSYLDRATARLWDIWTGRLLAEFPKREDVPDWPPAHSPDGRTVITLSGNLARVWGVAWATAPLATALREACRRRLGMASGLTRYEMRLAGYPDALPLADACESIPPQ